MGFMISSNSFIEDDEGIITSADSKSSRLICPIDVALADITAVQNQQAASGVHVDQDAIQKELAQNNASSGHRRTISSGVKSAPAPAKKWWEFWK